MTCKDCLHYEACRYNTFQEAHYFGKDKEIYITIDNNSPCKYFTNRSKWVYLPCTVGDTVYKLWYRPCHLGETYPDSYGCDGCHDECDIKKVITEYKVPSLRFIIDKLMNGSCVYYLTREEAEKVLEEEK